MNDKGGRTAAFPMKEGFIQKRLDDNFQLWLERASLWGCFLLLSLGGLDYLVAPEHFRLFLQYRIAVSLLLLAGYFLTKRLPQRYLPELAFILVLACVIAIELMILHVGGHQSPYYVGLILLGISVVGFVPARFRFHLVITVMIYCVYLVPILLLDTISNYREFLISNTFMVLIFSTMLLMRYLGGKALVTDLGLQYELEQYRNHLEDVVAERTAELAGAIEDLRKEISERKRAEDDRRALQEQLLQMQKMESIGRLAGGIAHDFNNVLTAILSYTELCLMKLPEDHAISGHLNGIREASEKAAGLTHQLLAFSRKQALSMRAVDLSAVVESMAGMLKRVIGEDVELELNVSRAIRTVLADVGQVEQVIMNLAVNARDAMPKGGALLIGTTEVDAEDLPQHGPDAVRPGRYVLLTVRDSGAGMSREVRDRIFEPFFTTKEIGLGTGLGLATVYGIVKQHNGHIFVDSDLGRGTEFRVYLPAGNVQPLIPQGETPAALPQGSEMVLVVEDDAIIRGLLREVLESLGYQVIEAESGPDALRKAAEYGKRIDLLLTDVVMPGMNGRELADLLRRERPGMRILYLSGYTQDILIKQGVLEPGAALIQKPLTTGILAQTVRRVLDGLT